MLNQIQIKYCYLFSSFDKVIINTNNPCGPTKIISIYFEIERSKRDFLLKFIFSLQNPNFCNAEFSIEGSTRNDCCGLIVALIASLTII